MTPPPLPRFIDGGKHGLLWFKHEFVFDSRKGRVISLFIPSTVVNRNTFNPGNTCSVCACIPAYQTHTDVVLRLLQRERSHCAPRKTGGSFPCNLRSGGFGPGGGLGVGLLFFSENTIFEQSRHELL